MLPDAGYFGLQREDEVDPQNPAVSPVTSAVERRLAAVVSADGKGYSRLMSEDEIGTVRTLTAYRSVMRDTINEFHGRVVDTPGDNVLAEFASVVDAVSCAVEIQRQLGERNAKLPERRRLEFRIGVNLGDVLVDGERIYGDTINVAARLEGLADARGICISGVAYDHIARKLDLEWDSLGEVAVKNFPYPIRAYRLRQGLPAVTSMSDRSAFVPAYRPSIAVLPFREIDISDARGYFGDGIAEHVVVALASLPDLFVVSRTSTARFRDSPTDVRSVGHELGVRYVLSGSVRRVGERLHIMAELADSETRTVLWTDKIEGQAGDLFDLQDRVSERTITTIAPNVREAEMRRVFQKRPESLDAYDFTLRGLDLLYRLHRGEFERARAMFDRAIALEPRYAAPYALSALWYSIRAEQGWSADPSADRAAVTRCAEMALERDPFDVRALALCGHLRAFQLRDYEGALALFDRALASSPNSSLAWVRSSATYSYLGDGGEATRRARQGLKLSPLDPHLFYTHGVLGLASYTIGDFDEAAAWGQQAMSENPRFTANLRILTAALAAAGRLGEARVVAARLLEADPGFRLVPFCDRYAFRDRDRLAALAAHLRAAGLPE
jgi:class 3 adenylate cyclase/tetratricopeptide (TPR) repeat protein